MSNCFPLWKWLWVQDVFRDAQETADSNSGHPYHTKNLDCFSPYVLARCSWISPVYQ